MGVGVQIRRLLSQQSFLRSTFDSRRNESCGTQSECAKGAIQRNRRPRRCFARVHWPLPPEVCDQTMKNLAKKPSNWSGSGAAHSQVFGRHFLGLTTSPSLGTPPTVDGGFPNLRICPLWDLPKFGGGGSSDLSFFWLFLFSGYQDKRTYNLTFPKGHIVKHGGTTLGRAPRPPQNPRRDPCRGL